MTREESLKSSLAKTEEKHCHHDCCKKSDDDHKDCQHDCHHHHDTKHKQQQHNRKRNGCALCGLMQIMNPFPVSGNVDDYEPTKFEEAMNVLTHLLPIAVFAYFSNRMFVENLVNSSEEMFVALVFCIGMCILFLVSSTYHLVCLIYGKNHPNVDFFRSMDYATIYIFIGASYTPWLSLVPLGEDGTYGKGMAVLVWSIAVIGLIKSYNPKFLPQIESVVLLNLMGWVAIIIIPPALFTHVPIEAFIFLLIGGVFYSGGCFILKYGDGRIPAAHAIWHMLVNCGVLFHFLVMEVYLINLDTHFRPGEEMPLMVYEQVIEAWNSNRTWHFPGINVLYR